MNKLIKIFIIILILLFALFIVDRSKIMMNNNIYENISNYKKENLDRYIKHKNINNNLTIEEVVKEVNINLDKAFYKDIFNALNEQTNLVLVNKHYKLSEDYVPNNLVELDYSVTSGINVLGDKEASLSFKEMSMDARALGLNIKAISGYRSYEYQKNLYERYLLNDPQDVVDTYSARAGHSEHQTGLSFDVYNIEKPYTDFGSTKEYEWLKINAHKYGFIIRYTKDNSYITGYKDEPWHIRYVGVNNATYIYENNITLEEYILNNGTFK